MQKVKVTLDQSSFLLKTDTFLCVEHEYHTMNAFSALCLSLENAKVTTNYKTFVLYKNENEPIAYVAFNHKNEMSNNYYHSNVTSMIGFNIKCDTDKIIELTPESFIHEVNARTSGYNYTTRRYEDIFEKIGSNIPILTSVDTSGWNEIFAEKFDSSWTNVCKYVYYNKSQLKYGMQKRTFRQDGNRCVPTKDGVLFSLTNETKIDMNESCTVCGIPVTWIVLNWMKTTCKKSVIDPALKNLFMRLYNTKKYYTNSGIRFYSQDDTDTMTEYIVFKSYAYAKGVNNKRLDNDELQKLLENPNVWYAPRWGYTLVRAPLLTNKDTE